MSPKRDSPEAPHFSLLGVHMVRSEEVFGRGTTIIVFFDGTSSNFWRERLTAVQERIADYRSQNVQVLGVTTDDASALEAYAAELGITFPLLADTDGRVSRRFNLFDEENGVSVRAVALIHDGRLVFTEEVEKTEVPGRLRPWAERLELS